MGEQKDSKMGKRRKVKSLSKTQYAVVDMNMFCFAVVVFSVYTAFQFKHNFIFRKLFKSARDWCGERASEREWKSA